MRKSVCHWIERQLQQRMSSPQSDWKGESEIDTGDITPAFKTHLCSSPLWKRWPSYAEYVTCSTQLYRKTQFFTIPLHQQDWTALFPLDNREWNESLTFSPSPPSLLPSLFERIHFKAGMIKLWMSSPLHPQRESKTSKTAKWLTWTAFGQRICKRCRLPQCQRQP